MNDLALTQLLKESRIIAVVGLSPKPERPSHRVAAYLQQAGYQIIPVRPGLATILGETCYPSLKDIPPEIQVDIVDVFRRTEQTPPIAQASTSLKARALWLQSGIVNDESMRIAQKAGMMAIQDLCLMVEHRRLLA